MDSLSNLNATEPLGGLGALPTDGSLGGGFELPTFPKGFEAGNFGPPPTNIYQGDNTADYSKYGFSSGLQDFFKDQNRPADIGKFNYDIASGTFGMGGMMPGQMTAGQKYFTGMRNIPKDVMEQYIQSQSSGNPIDLQSKYGMWNTWGNDPNNPTPETPTETPTEAPQPPQPITPTAPTTTPSTTPTTLNPFVSGGLSSIIGASVGATQGNSMTDLFQGAPLPDVTSTIQKETTTPEFYTNYLQDIANLGQSAVQQGGVAGFSPLQQQAFQMAPDLAFAGSGSLGQANQMITGAGGTATPEIIQNYMNPYQNAVVDEMGRLSQRNVQENVLPNLGGVATGMGQFGSRRQQQITGNTLRDIQADLLGKQANVLSGGYDTATKAAQADLQRQLSAGSYLTQLGQEQQQVGTGGLNQLYTMGANQQKLGQQALDYPMIAAQNYAKLLQNQNIPQGSVQQTVAPGNQGQFGLSPLAQIGSLGSILYSLYSGDPSAALKSATAQVTPKVPAAAEGGSMTQDSTPSEAAYHDGQGNYYDANGYLVG